MAKGEWVVVSVGSGQRKGGWVEALLPSFLWSISRQKADTKDKGIGMAGSSSAAEKGTELRTDQTDKRSRGSITPNCFICSG